MKIALVDDDLNLSESLTLALKHEGYDVSPYENGLKALQGVTRNPVDIAIVDIKMPVMDGYEFLEKIRSLEKTGKKKHMPIIFLTSKGDPCDEVVGLKMGAEDYIKKPFNQRVLLERIKKIGRMLDAPENAKEETMSIKTNEGELILNTSRHSCIWKGSKVDLTVTEFRLLKALVRHPGHVKNRDQLIDSARGEDIHVEERTIDSHVKRIRRKFKQVDPKFSRIKTIYGIGYSFELK